MKSNICNKTNSSKQIGATQEVNKSTARYEFSFSFNKHLNILLIVMCLFLSVSGLSSQKLGCSINKDICGFYEYCDEDSFLGECRNMLESDDPITLKTRNEVEFDSNIDAPIRIHKYNLHKKNLKEQDYDEDEQEGKSFEDDNLVSNKNDLLEKSLDIIQKQENDDDDDSDDQYNEVDDYDIEETKRGTSESDENSSESDEDSSESGEDSNESGEDSNESGKDSNESGEDSSEDKDEEEESDEKYYDPHLSLLGQRRKRLTLLKGPNDNIISNDNYYDNYDDQPKNIDDLLKIYAKEPNFLEDINGIENILDYSNPQSSLLYNQDSSEESEEQPIYPLSKVKKMADEYSGGDNTPLKLTEDSKENLLDILSTLKENIKEEENNDEDDEDKEYLNFNDKYLTRSTDDEDDDDDDDDDDNDDGYDENQGDNNYEKNNLGDYLRTVQKKSILNKESGDDEENILVKPFVYENSGEDQNGNKFHEKDVLLKAASKLNPNNKFESFSRTYDVVNDKNPFEYRKESAAQKELTVEDYFEPSGQASPLKLTGLRYNLAKDTHAPMKMRINNLKFQLNKGDEIIKEMNNVLSHQMAVDPVENVLSSLMSHSYEPEMPASFLPTFKEKLNENINLAKKANNGLNLQVNSHRVNPNIVSESKESNEAPEMTNVFNAIIGEPFEQETEPKTNDYFVPIDTPLTHMKIGLHYNLNKENSDSKTNNLKLQMNRANQIMSEINDVLTHSHSLNPVEDVVNAFMTHHYEPDMPSTLLPTFKEKLKENVELAKKTYDNFDLHVNSHRINPNILVEENIDTSIKNLKNENKDNEKKNSSHVKHHFDTNDYFEPIRVDSETSKEINKLKTDLNKEQEDFIRNFYPKKTDAKWYEANNDANMENSAEHSALNALLKNLNGKYDYVDSSYIFIELEKSIKDYETVTLLGFIASLSSIPVASFQDISVQDNLILFKINDPSTNSTKLIEQIFKHREELKEKGFNVISCGLGREDHRIKINKQSEYILLVTIVLCVSIASTLIILFAIFIIRRRIHLRNKLIDDVRIKKPAFDDEERLVKAERQNNKPWYSFIRREQVDETPKQDYQELCRQRMHGAKHGKESETPGMNTPGMNTTTKTTINSTPIRVNMEGSENNGDSNRSSTSSWSEEPISTVNMDITTGHVILSYMEEHLNDKNRLSKEWKELENYEPDQKSTYVGSLPAYMTRNRYSNILPYDHNRVKIGQNPESDYINASFIMDDDPKNPVYIATQGPLMNTTNDFWQMVWEQGSVIIVNLCRTVENGSIKCNQYWPSNGFEVNDKFEVHLVSEHVWCEDYLVRNFFLKNLETSQTRTVTQFHFLTWTESGNPQNVKTVLDFRRKVNKSYKSKSSPIIVHCNDGIGRTGTYIMIDMVLNKIARGAKEIDLAATLEYLRDQRPGIIKTKNQFEFSFAVVTEEVQNMLKALNP